MAKYRLNNQTKKNLKQVEDAFAAGGFEAGEVKALARMYYAAICNKHSRLAALKKLDEPDEKIEDNPLEDLE